MVTAIGDDNLLMAYVHVAHDVIIHNHTILANGVTFAGHVIVEDYGEYRRPVRHSSVRAASAGTPWSAATA